jgi:hypothetical protein
MNKYNVNWRSSVVFQESKLVMSTLLKTRTWPAAKSKTSKAEGIWADHYNLQATRQMFSCFGGCASIERAVNPAATKDEEFRK